MNRDRRLANLFFLGFSIISVLFLVMPVGPFVRSARAVAAFTVMPVVKWADSSAKYLTGVYANISLLLRTEEENRRLRSENKELELLRARLEAAQQENGRLRETFHLSGDWDWTGAWARVVSRNRDRWYSSVMVDKGEKDGVRLHSPVVAVFQSSACVAGK
ncbi:MAG TPA: rod shape-determining protein MreC, partial [Elusimicrobiales bacterium]|nr:rod shape-determining protein MreC [Elusimicrobiales bacterium]